MMNEIELDGAQGEGGGQILRTALSLSMITGHPFSINGIRAKRAKPGLLRQHLTAVQAAAEICGAQVSGAALGSQALSFRPGPIKRGDYRFTIGTAGSCTLVLQTVLPALWFADGPATVVVSGGTHSPAAPPADFLMQAWLPVMRQMGVETELELLRHGFYPAGGGEVRARTRPVKALSGLNLEKRGTLLRALATSVVAGVPGSVAIRELECLADQLGKLQCPGELQQEIRTLHLNHGPGNVLMLVLEYEGATELCTEFGQKGVSAERVAYKLARKVQHYLDREGVLGEYLADQLVLPLALAGQGGFTTTDLSSHLLSNIGVIQYFLPVHFENTPVDGGYRVDVLAA